MERPTERWIVQRLAIIGLGLIGGSLARALRAAGAVEHISGYDIDPEQRRAALELGVVDSAPDSAVAAVQGADLVVLAVPVMETAAALAALRPALGADAVMTDVGSTKCSVIEAVAATLGEVPANYVPGHPIAGTEKSGVAASFDSLFRGRRVILTPHARMSAQAGQRVQAMWEAVGAQVEHMPPAHHDEILAATSHLPHVLAYALVDMLARMESEQELFAYAAGGFRDFTRITSSSPKMWLDITCANRAALIPLIENYVDALNNLRDAIRDDDQQRVLDVFTHARGARERYLERMEESLSSRSTTAS